MKYATRIEGVRRSGRHVWKSLKKTPMIGSYIGVSEREIQDVYNNVNL